MSELIPRYGGRGGGRGSENEFAYGPWTYGQLPSDIDPDSLPLPPIDYTNIAYDSWGIRLSLRGSGVPDNYMDWYVRRSNGPTTFYYGRDLIHDTLLYRMCLSRSAHDEFDRDIAYLYTGFLRTCMDIDLMVIYYEFSDDLLWNIGRLGGYFIMAPFYEYDIIGLCVEGFYYSRDPDSDREIEE